MIVINDKYAVKSDTNQWILCRAIKPSKSQPDGWSGFKFYGSLQALISHLRGILLRESDYQSFADLERNTREITRLLDKKLKAVT